MSLLFADKTAMKKELLKSLKEIQPHVNSPERLQLVTQELRKHKLSENYVQQTLQFVLLLLDEMPEIMQGHPHDKRLKEICQYCIEQQAITDKSLKANLHKKRRSLSP